MANINEVLRQTIKIIKSFDHPITRSEITMYGLDNFIHSIRHVSNGDFDILFDFGKYSFDEKSDLGIIKVSYKLLMYIYEGGHIRFSTDYTEEQLFQQSTVQNYYDLEPDFAENMKKLIVLLEHLWDGI